MYFKKCHPDKVKQYNDLKDRLRLEFPRKRNETQQGFCNFNQEEFDKNVVSHLLKTGIPIANVGKKSFKKIFTGNNLECVITMSKSTSLNALF